jgi:hypothetical protein
MNRAAFVHDAAVAHLDHAVDHVGFDHQRIVAGEQDGAALVGQAFEDAHEFAGRCVSRLAVGSSAISSSGSLISARQIATRCCSPPESHSTLARGGGRA